MSATGGLLVAVTLAAFVVSQLPSWPYAAPSTSALPVGLEQAIPLRDPVTLTYPYPPLVQPLLWQSNDDYKFSIVGGFARHSNAAGSAAGYSLSPIPMNPPELQQFLLIYDYGALYRSPSAQAPGAPITPSLLKATRTALLRYRVRVVIVDRTFGGALHVIKLFEEALGPRTKSRARTPCGWTCRECWSTGPPLQHWPNTVYSRRSRAPGGLEPTGQP